MQQTLHRLEPRDYIASALFALMAIGASCLPSCAVAQSKAPVSASAPALTPQANLDKLFARLGEAKSEQEAKGIATSIERVWLRSGSDTGDLLLNRAIAAVSIKDYDLAANVLDRLIELEPDWAEAWNKRATLRFLRDDDNGSVSDIAHVLALEPRHFGALAGLGTIMMRNGYDKGALQAYRQLLSINPTLDHIRKIIEKLVPEVEGREL